MKIFLFFVVFPTHYNDNICDNISEYECYPTNIIPYFNDRIQWTIYGEQCNEFMNSNLCKLIQTNWFNINDFRFKLSCFPNGNKQKYK